MQTFESVQTHSRYYIPSDSFVHPWLETKGYVPVARTSGALLESIDLFVLRCLEAGVIDTNTLVPGQAFLFLGTRERNPRTL